MFDRPTVGLALTGALQHDLGRFEITGEPEDRWAYTTPPLRGVKKVRPTCTTEDLRSSKRSSTFMIVAGEQTRRSTRKSSRSASAATRRERSWPSFRRYKPWSSHNGAAFYDPT